MQTELSEKKERTVFIWLFFSQNQFLFGFHRFYLKMVRFACILLISIATFTLVTAKNLQSHETSLRNLVSVVNKGTFTPCYSFFWTFFSWISRNFYYFFKVYSVTCFQFVLCVYVLIVSFQHFNAYWIIFTFFPLTFYFAIFFLFIFINNWKTTRTKTWKSSRLYHVNRIRIERIQV